MTGTYKLADLNIRITSEFEETHQLLRDYRSCPGSPTDMDVRTWHQDLEYERQRALQEDLREERMPRSLPDPYLETLAVYRKIAEQLPEKGRLLMHGSCISVDGCAYLFTAKSGIGKSTHTGLWREMLKDRAVMVNDDKPVLGISEKGVTAYGTPWDGKHRLSRNIAVPLKAVCILERAEENRIQKMSAMEAYPMLLQQIYRPMDTEMLGRSLELIDRLSKNVSLWHLCCNISLEAAEIAYNAMKE